MLVIGLGAKKLSPSPFPPQRCCQRTDVRRRPRAQRLLAPPRSHGRWRQEGPSRPGEQRFKGGALSLSPPVEKTHLRFDLAQTGPKQALRARCRGPASERC